MDTWESSYINDKANVSFTELLKCLSIDRLGLVLVYSVKECP